MRKIWGLRRDKEREREKEKRRSFNGSSSLYYTTSNHTALTRESSEFDQKRDLDDATLAHSIHDSQMSALTNITTSNSTTVTNISNTTNVSNATQNTFGSNMKLSALDPTRLSRSLQTLVKPEHDISLIKNSWMNVVVNTSANDVEDLTLRLYRAELKGSHMYLYKSSLNYRSFKLYSEPKDEYGNSRNIHDFDLASISGLTNVAVPGALTGISGPQSAPLLSSSPHSVQIHSATTSTFADKSRALSPLQPPEIFKQQNVSNPSIAENNLSILTPTPKGTEPSANSEDYRITYKETTVPHPDLKFNFETSSFQPDCSIESYIHFLLFQYSDSHMGAVKQVINLLPLFPDFGKTLRLVNSMLTDLFLGKFAGEYQLHVILDRALQILNNVSENFKGFLLKSDVAPYILRLLEILNDKVTREDVNSHSEFLEKLKTFKTGLLAQQQGLIDLISREDQYSDCNPLQELNASFFLNHVNPLELTSTINAIDLAFFKDWNSNIDKSLLLYTTINQTVQNGNPADAFYRKNPLFFSNEFHMHYLSRLLINHLFLESNAAGLSSSTSSLEFKARLLEKWIDLGCLLDKSGNMSSWLGIASVILSQPILRLSKIWSFVTPDYIRLLKNDWSPVLFELDRRFLVNSINSSAPNSPNQNAKEEDIDPLSVDSYHIMAPRGLGKIYSKDNVIPFFGDLLSNNLSVKNINELDSTYKKINYSFSRWNDYSKDLVDYNDIIKYNDDVLKRYDMMGFIFSNESLNQVLYLGVNDDAKSLPPTFEMPRDDKNPSNFGLNYNSNVSPKIKEQLLKLIELNSSGYSVNLDKLMVMSLTFQSELPESYLKPNVPFYKNLPLNHSNLSLNSVDSYASTQTESASGISNLHDARSKLPTFNNKNFKLNLFKYDELASDSGTATYQNPESKDNKHNIKIDSELIFRIDDFVRDFDAQGNNSFNALDEVDNEEDDEEVAGLGIDVDELLNSDKFNNFSINEPTSSESENGNSTAKKTNPQSHATNSFSVISSDSSQLQIYKYIPKFATIDRLIDLLIIDSKYLDETITIDLSEYRFVFLLNYNSFITTRELLDKLAHRFINSGNAVISIMKKLHAIKNNQQNKISDQDFPNWNLDTSVDLSELGDVDYSVLLRIQINILKVLVLLINNFYSNFSMDLINKKILVKLLKLFSNEILQWYNSNKIDAELEKSFESLVNYYKKLKKLFVKKTYRPIELGKFNEFLVNDFKFNNSLHEVPMNRNLPGHKNVHKIEKFLHKFNKLLTVFYKGIKIEDWIKVYKVMEIEFEKNHLLEFNLQKPETPDEQLVVSNIFNYLDTLNDPNEKQLILKKFPLVFRKLFKLYNKFKTYLLIQLTDLNITVDERLDRMKTLLYMSKICQLKMQNAQFVFESKKRGPIPSCIESAITNVIYSPESRLFTNLWLKATAALNDEELNLLANFDDLNLLLPKSLTIKHLAIHQELLLPCFGWIIENLLEMNKITHFNNRNLINFNKRYLIFKILKELSIEESDSSEDFSHNETREFEFLLKLDENLVNNKNLKEFTLLEKDRVKIFRAVLKEQHKILITDNRKKQLKESLTKEGGIMTHQNGSLNSLNQSLHKKSSNSALRRQSLSYKPQNSGSRFKISGFFNKSRPFSLGGNGVSSGSQQWYEKSIAVKDLPDAATFHDGKQKPTYVIPLKNKKIFPVYLLPFSFKIDSDSSSKEDDYFFQCLGESDLNDWLMKLNYANRHWFFSRTLNIKSGSGNYLTFGIPINVVCNRQNRSVPKFLVDIFQEIEEHGIKDVGVYRISTSISELTNLKTTIDKVGFIDFEERGYDTHALTSCVKSYFRELPDALLTDQVIESCFELRQKLVNDELDRKSMVLEFKEILKSLPPVNYETLKVLMEHLEKVVLFSDDNKMTPANVATVIGPALTEASNLEILVNNFGFMNYILERLITNFKPIFVFSEEEVAEIGTEEEKANEPPASDITLDVNDTDDAKKNDDSATAPAEPSEPSVENTGESTAEPNTTDK